MMKKIIFLFLLITTKFLFSQCNNCSKNFGGWIDDSMVGMKKTKDGFLYVYHADNSYTYAKLIKFDFNCNILWQKSDVIQSFATDDMVISIP